MGFLDFLKKEKPAVTPSTVQVPPPPGAVPQPPVAPAAPPALPADPSEIDWTAPPKFSDDLPPLPPPKSSVQDFSAAQPSPAAPSPAAPVAPEQPKELPLVNTADAAFLDSMAKDLDLPPEQKKRAEFMLPQAPAQPAPKIELPDFTDDDFAMLTKPAAPPVIQPMQPAPVMAPPPLPAAVEVITEEPVVSAPANAIAIPDDEIRLPTGEELELAKVEPAKFISSQSYFTITADIKAIRKSLRQNDDVIKEGILRHEQLDMQYKRVASDMNAVQEQLMKVDEALFE